MNQVRVFSLASTPTVEQIKAARNGESVAAFLEELENKGVYRIGRVVTFLDDTYPRWFQDNALHHVSGGLFKDGMGITWSSAYMSGARRYNIEIGVAASGYVEEIQYDYVRLPYENGLRERLEHTETDRVAAITRFAREASEALHLAGLAVSFDTFGVILDGRQRSGHWAIGRRSGSVPRLRLTDGLSEWLVCGIVRIRVSAGAPGDRGPVECRGDR